MEYLIIIVALLVLVVLGLGIFNLARGGENSDGRSNKLMKWRIGLQALALGLLLVMYFIN